MRWPHPGPLHFLALAAAGGAVCYFAAGVLALQGFALGAGSGAFNMLAMWGAITLMGRAHQSDRSGPTDRPLGGAFLALAFLLKLPAYVMAGMAAQRLAGPAPGAFLAAIGMVYFGLLWWALTRR